MRSLISIADLTNDEIEEIFSLADAAQRLRSERPANGQIMATLFYEPSTRTRLSFESAMQRLGGSVISCSDMKSSSVAKGETLADTAKVVSAYADVLVVRHNWDGAVQAMAEHADVPIINAGDGGHEHPTQTLCDLYTLRQEKGALKGLTVVVCGDLKNGRTIHSLVFALARFGANVVTLAANGMELPQYVLERLEREYGYALAPMASDDLNAVMTETDALYLTPKQPHQLALFTQVDEVIQARLNSLATGLRYDAFYMTRKQKERMKDGAADASYPTIGPEFLREQRFQDTVVMHPLPRVNELSPELDRDRRGIYFKQAAYGVPVRMALLKFLFDRREAKAAAPINKAPAYKSPEKLGPLCHNPNCVTLKEPVSTDKRFELFSVGENGTLILGCAYCDHRFKVQFVGDVKSKRYCSYDHSLAGQIDGWLEKKQLAIFNSIKEAEELGYEPIKSGPQRALMNDVEIASALAEMSRQILRDCRDPDRLLILGVRSVGSQLAQRIAAEIESQRKRKIEMGEIEIYGSADEIKRLAPSDPDAAPLSLKDREVILVDDVIHTGRTVKSALSIIFRSGRPQSVRLAVLIDRGHREVPVKPNYVGKNIPSSEKDRVRVKLRGLDQEERDQVVIFSVISPADGLKSSSAGAEKKAARQKTMKAILALADGKHFEGVAFGAEGEAIGEVVFNTSMTGYQEILTDPSYEGQLVAMTYPQIGNVGVNLEDVESRKPFMRGFIVKDYTAQPSNWRAREPLHEYMQANGIVGIQGIDTRSLVRHLRDHGAQDGIISTADANPAELAAKAKASPGLIGIDLVKNVTCDDAYDWNQGMWGLSGGYKQRDGGKIAKRRGKASFAAPNYFVVAYDFGIKYNILRNLAESGCQVKVVPASMPAEAVLALNPDGIFLSNGPGDPDAVPYAKDNVQKLIGKKPIFGICLGHQIMGLALGGKTFKLKFGHHGGNQPVMDLTTRKVEITAQNHGFAVDADSLGGAVQVTHLNLNDNTVEGLAHRELPIFSIQYHPESSPGPHDADYLFKRFTDMMAKHRG